MLPRDDTLTRSLIHPAPRVLLARRRLHRQGALDDRTARRVVLDDSHIDLIRPKERPLDIENGRMIFYQDDRLDLVSETARERSAISLGVMRSLDLTTGAFATRFSHDGHNMLIVGRDPDEMAGTADALHRQRGGMVSIEHSPIAVGLDLSVISLLNGGPALEVADELAHLKNTHRRLGMTHDRPFLILSLLSYR